MALLRRLLDGERFSHEGTFYTLHDALCEPRPVQAHLPILIGGCGPKKTLRTVALRGRCLEHVGDVEEVREQLGILDEHCAAVGRDLAEIELTISFPIIIRDDRGGGRAHGTPSCAGTTASPEIERGAHTWLGPPRRSRRRIRPYVELGFRTSSSGCRRRTTARRSSACRRSGRPGDVPVRA